MREKSFCLYYRVRNEEMREWFLIFAETRFEINRTAEWLKGFLYYPLFIALYIFQ